MRPYTWHQPTRIVMQQHAASLVGRAVRASGATHPLVVLGGSSARRSGVWREALESLAAEGLTHELVEGIPENPGSSVIDAGAAAMRAARCDAVIAIGGGSVLDAGKAMAVVAANTLPARELLGGIAAAPPVIGRAHPIIAVPTLPGSASEVNGTSVITDDDTGRKLSMHSPYAVPHTALVDPIWAAAAPAPLLRGAAFDTVAHALESMLSRRATTPSIAMARQALEFALPAAQRIAAGDDPDAVADLFWASQLAGWALATAGSIMTHPLSHTVTARIGVRHAEAVAILEAHVLRALAEAAEHAGARDLERDAPRIVAATSAMGAGRSTKVPTALTAIARRVDELRESLQLPRALADTGWVPDDASTAVADTLASASRGLANTPFAVIDEQLLHDVLARATSAPTRAQRARSRASSSR